MLMGAAAVFAAFGALLPARAPAAVDGNVALGTLDDVSELDGKWRFHTGDDMRFAEPAFDDAAWPLVTVPKGIGAQGYEDYVGFYWLRLRVHAPVVDAAGTRQLALQLWYVDSAYEAYVDGVKVGERGSFDPVFDDDSHPGIWSMPNGAFSDGEAVIAIRGYRSADRQSAGPKRGGITRGPNAIGPTSTMSRAFVASDLDEWMLAGSFLVVGIYHLQLFRKRRAFSEYLWFGVFCVAIAAYGLTQIALVQFALPVSVQGRLWFGSITIALVTFIEFLWPFLGQKLNKVWRLWQAAVVAFGVVGLAWPTPWFTHRFLLEWELVLVLPFLAANCILIGRKAWRGDPDARTIALGTLLMVGTALNNILRTVGVQTPEITNYAFGAFVLSMAVSLSNRYARVHDEVDALLVKTLKLSRMKDELLANTSHELRTPLNAIINLPRAILAEMEPREVVACGACGALFAADDDDDGDGGAISVDDACSVCGERALKRETRRVSPDDADGLAQKLEGVVTSGQQLLGVVSDMLDTSKIAAGAMDLQREDVHVRDVVDVVLDEKRASADARKVILAKAIDRNLVVHADRARLAQILEKLVDNAVKLSPPGEVVDVKARVVSASGAVVADDTDPRGADDKAGRRIEIRVTDRGPGIAPQHHAVIFEPFRQIDGGVDHIDDVDSGAVARHTRKHGGAGLGLSIAKALTELHGGALTVESELGKGATFIVSLPSSPPR